VTRDAAGPPSAPVVTVDRSTVTSLDLVDHREMDWSRVRRAAYLIHQTLRYQYPGPIYDLDHRLVVIPPARHGDQRLIVERVDVSAPPDLSPSLQREIVNDAFGNSVLRLRMRRVAHILEFDVWVVVERSAPYGPVPAPLATLIDERLHAPSALTAPDDALRDLALRLKASGDRGVALAERINAQVFERLSFTRGVTSVRTTAAEAFALRQGVCQDYAHVMLALCRLCDLPARYVSGHLLGEGGSHAWVEVIVPSVDDSNAAIAVAFDPTHARRGGHGYVTVGVGRDYADVAPTSGTYRAPHAGWLSVRRRAGVTAVEYASADGAPDRPRP
jgi:transglutaminase-like putative cysteine protease